MSEHYRIFGCFYDVRSKETAQKIITDMEEVAKNKATEAVKSATEAAAENAVKTEVDRKMNEVTKTISETSVTILGIFAGIVLTIVAGLFYSSSVLENINSASIYKLIAVSALVGIVCLDLLAVMFQYIERIHNSDSSQSRYSNFVVGVNVCLVSIMIIFVILCYFVPGNSEIKNYTVNDVMNVNVNVSNDSKEAVNNAASDIFATDTELKE